MSKPLSKLDVNQALELKIRIENWIILDLIPNPPLPPPLPSMPFFVKFEL